MNRFRGDASVTVDGVTHRLRLDFNALANFEALTGKDALVVLSDFEGGQYSVTDLRNLVLAMLQRDNPDATAELAGDILSEGIEVLNRLLAAAMPAQADDPEPPGKRTRARG